MSWWHVLQHWLAYHTGSLNEPGAAPGSAFWGGIGSVVIPPLLSGLVVAALFWWHHQCHAHGCYWYARRTTAAGERACWRHHPERKRTAGDIHAAHHAAKGGSP